MEITIKNVKTNLAFSHETICFRASFYVDGKKAGTAENDGHGGCTFCCFDDRDLRKKVEAYFESLPEKRCEEYDFSYKQSLDYRIDELVQEYLKERDYKTKTKTKIIYRLKSTPSNSYATYGYKRGVVVTSAMRQELVNDIKKEYGDQITEIIDGTKWWGK